MTLERCYVIGHSNLMTLQPLQVHEGYCEEIYLDKLKKLTFGIGHLIKETDPENGVACGTIVTTERVLSVFEADATSHVAECYRLYPEFDCQPDFVQLIIGDMMFNLGYGTPNKPGDKEGLSDFGKMKAAVLAKDYDRAADEMVNSDWYGQTGRRARKLVSMMRAMSAEHGYKETDINTSLCEC